MSSSEKIDEIWLDDKLNRRQDAKFLYDFLLGQIEKLQRSGRTRAYTLNIDASWGGGKSFFLRRFAKQLEAEGHLVCLINAWKDDHADDPYVAIMSAIDNVLLPFVKKERALAKVWKATKTNGTQIAAKAAGGFLKETAKRYLSLSAEDFEVQGAGSIPSALAEAGVEGAKVAKLEIEGLFDRTLQQHIDQFTKTKAAVDEFQSKLQQALIKLHQEKKSPLFILVDEVDRCRPSYAVRLLERVKHLFEVDGIAFIFATNSAQLRHSVSGAYGPSFDGYMYLKRFFDRTYVFADPSDHQLIEDWCQSIDRSRIRAPFDDLTGLLSGCRQAYDLDLRSIHQIIEMLDAVVTAWRHPMPVEACLLVPVCIAFYLTGASKFEAVDQAALREVVLRDKNRVGRNIDQHEINVGEAFSESLAISFRLEDAVDYNSERGNSFKDRYVFNIFSPEWDGRVIDGASCSKQRDIPYLVGSAGRLSVS